MTFPSTSTSLTVSSSSQHEYDVSTRYIDVSRVIIHKEPSCTVQHWQLRDLLLCCPHHPSQFYYMNKREVYRYDTTVKKSTLIQSIDFTPVSMSVKNGYIVTGGHESQVSVKSLTTGQVIHASYHVGGAINNACHISSHLWPLSSRSNNNVHNNSHNNNHNSHNNSHNGGGTGGSPHLFLSNNDHTIKILDLPSLDTVQSLELGVACNYTTTTRDGKRMAVVTDNNTLYLYDIMSGSGSSGSNSGGIGSDTSNRGNVIEQFRLSAKLQDYTDGGFSCAFDSQGTKLAAASQDGSVVVWDLRNTVRCLKRFESRQRDHKGACRNVKFSPIASVDLLVFSEHESFVHVVDMRTLERQTISVVEQIPEDVRRSAASSVPSETMSEFMMTGGGGGGGGGGIGRGGIGGRSTTGLISFDTLTNRGATSVTVVPPGGDLTRPSRVFVLGRSSQYDICGIDFNADSSSLFVGLTSHVQEYPIDLLGRRMFADGILC